MAEKWIQKALSGKGDKGRLHRALGVPEGETIPQDKLNAAMHSDRTFEGKSVARMARMAKSMRKMMR